MRKVARAFRGERGVVLHLGDSITRDPAYVAYARAGIGRAAEELAVCEWMHASEESSRNGWFLAAGEHEFARTAFNGISAGDFLNGSAAGPTVAEVIERYRPQMAVVMFGTNEATRFVPVQEYRANIEQVLKLLVEANCVPILSTVPPHYKRLKRVREYNEGIRAVAARMKIPLIDFFSEMASRRPMDWNGSLMEKNDVHPSGVVGSASPEGPATEANLRQSGYLLRGWLSLRKIMEVKQHVLEAMNAA